MKQNLGQFNRMILTIICPRENCGGNLMVEDGVVKCLECARILKDEEKWNTIGLYNLLYRELK